MVDKNKMPIVLVGNYSSKYEIESICKLFFNTARFRFSSDVNDAQGESYILASTAVESEILLTAEIRLDGDTPERQIKTMSVKTKKDDIELELCRLVYHILCRKTGIRPPWGLMTGIRPVKKVKDLVCRGLDRESVGNYFRDKYEVSEEKFSIAYRTALNQIPILENLDGNSVSLYISIPFCPSRCSYCSFVSHSVTMKSAVKLIPEYVSALCRELEITGELVSENGLKVETVYFGGGTPVAISAEQIKILMECVEKIFDLTNLKEYDFEAGRPDAFTEEKLRVVKNFGVTRISVNPQTLNNEVLKTIGRHHTAEDTLKAFELARKVGFKNINMDLIAGLPNDTAESFGSTLEKILTLSPESITVHTLTLKRSSELFQTGSTGNPASEMVGYSIGRLIDSGYEPYYMYCQKNTVENLENIGYAKKGCESLYNIFIMDEIQTIIGAGCGASTKMVFPDGMIRRFHNHKYPYEYITRFDELMQRKEEISECLKKINSMRLK